VVRIQVNRSHFANDSQSLGIVRALIPTAQGVECQGKIRPVLQIFDFEYLI
jgi:hypothetical protein